MGFTACADWDYTGVCDFFLGIGSSLSHPDFGHKYVPTDLFSSESVVSIEIGLKPGGTVGRMVFGNGGQVPILRAALCRNIYLRMYLSTYIPIMPVLPSPAITIIKPQV